MDLATAASIAGIVGAAFVIIFGGKGAIDAVAAIRKRRHADPENSEDDDGSAPIGIEAYQQRVRLSHEKLRFGDPTSVRAFDQSNGTSSGISLSDIYTPLSVA